MKTSDYITGTSRLWWVPILSGLFFIAFGVLCLCDPSSTLPVLAYVFAGCIGAIGLFNLIFALCNVSVYRGWGFAAAGGVIEILFSIFLFFIPSSILTYVFTYGVGIYIIFMTVYSFFDGLMMTKASFWYWFVLLFLLAALVFALIYILGPIGGAVLGWLYIGISFVCYGVCRIMLAIRLHSLGRE